MAIKTPDLLPGEEGYVSKKEKTITRASIEKKGRIKKRKQEQIIGKIKPGKKGCRIGRSTTTPRKEKRYPIWRYSRKIGEILVSNKGSPKEKISLRFKRLGGIGNYKHLIQDADFQLRWAIREQELLITQDNCYLCKKKLSKISEPNLYHIKIWKKRAELLERAEKVPEEVIKGKITLCDGWAKFNSILEEGNRYYMSLRDTALICRTCLKKKGISY
jgi:hypothetical protein|tara:strand:+ start:1005 stop:1655 length:651 start_codon:yes stop_codon:yes gene_type:complete